MELITWMTEGKMEREKLGNYLNVALTDAFNFENKKSFLPSLKELHVGVEGESGTEKVSTENETGSESQSQKVEKKERSGCCCDNGRRS